MLFRKVKGSLQDSLKTITEIYSVEDIKDIVNTDFSYQGATVEEVKCQYECYDDRIKWDSYIISVKFHNDPIIYPVGYTNSRLNCK